MNQIKVATSMYQALYILFSTTNVEECMRYIQRQQMPITVLRDWTEGRKVDRTVVGQAVRLANALVATYDYLGEKYRVMPAVYVDNSKTMLDEVMAAGQSYEFVNRKNVL